VAHKAREKLSDVHNPLTGEPLTFPDTQKLPEAERGAALAGELVGGSLAGVGSVVGLARTGYRFGASRIGGYVNNVLNTAQHKTGQFLVTEGLAVAGAAGGGALATNINPDSLLLRMAGEVAGGVMAPGKLAVFAYNKTKGILTKTLQTFSEEAKLTRAGVLLNQIVLDRNEDPLVIARVLEEAVTTLGPQTSAQKSRSEALAIVEAGLRSQGSKASGAFSREAAEMATANLRIIDTMIHVISESGDPGKMAHIARLERHRFQTLFDQRLLNAEHVVQDLAAAISLDSPLARTQLSTIANDIMGAALSQSRKAETALWQTVPKDVKSMGEAGLAAIRRHLDELVPGQELPKVVTLYLQRATAIDEVTGAAVGTTTGELQKMRSQFLSLARDAASKMGGTTGGVSSRNLARIYGDIAENLADDLDNAFKVGVPGVGNDAWQRASAFSRELNDAFSRTFAGKAMSRGPSGADRTPPELMMQKALAAGGDAAALRFDELESASRFLLNKNVADTENVEALATGMEEVQNRLLRLAASDVIDADTGLPSVAKLKTFTQKHAKLLERFPEIAADLEAAKTSALKLADVARRNVKFTRVLERHAAFEKLRGEHSIDAVKQAMRSDTPVRGLTALAKLAKRGGTEAVEGLQASVYAHAMVDATDEATGFINYQRLRRVLFTGMQPGRPSLVDVMMKQGVLDEQGVKNLTKLLDEADNILKVGKETTEGATDITTGATGHFSEMMTRLAGVKVASKINFLTGGSGSSGALIIASAGSKFAKSVMDKVPNENLTQIFIQAAIDPQFMAMLLRKPKSVPEQFTQARWLHAYLYQGGYLAATEKVETDLQSDDERRATSHSFAPPPPPQPTPDAFNEDAGEGE